MKDQKNVIPKIYIVSGGVGASGENLVQTVLAQFPSKQADVIPVVNIRQVDQIERAVLQAKANQGIVVHTLVDSELREKTTQLSNEYKVFAIDLMGPLIEQLTKLFKEPPAEQPGLYRRLNQAYYERVEAIEFTMAHDDGKKPEDLCDADTILVGVSRTGKTPISLYLSVLGWKVANIPFVPGLSLPKELFEVDHGHVVGLTIEAGQLLLHRKQRQNRLGAPGPTPYTDHNAVYQEIQAARALYKKQGFLIVDVTDKPIESCVDEIVRRMTFGHQQAGHNSERIGI
jgi:regulator of PEP synthase PpsR (kinase-PPPase family)